MRSGSVPTDKKFTGQGLDGTGLYYYNARYYDPAIGRFISADTIIPNPANPQSFNRYSYVLNNPLKFIDPSGNDIEIGGVTAGDLENWVDNMDYWALVAWGQSLTDEDRELWDGWSAFAGAAPAEAQALRNDPTVWHIKWGELNNRNYAQTEGNITTINTRYWTSKMIGSEVINKLTKVDLAALMGHEGFHELMDMWGFGHNSFFEEACANAIQASVLKALGSVPRHPESPFDDLTPSMTQPEIDAYLNGTDWKYIYGQYCQNGGDYYYYPDKSESYYTNMEGYDLMNWLWLTYLP